MLHALATILRLWKKRPKESHRGQVACQGHKPRFFWCQSMGLYHSALRFPLESPCQHAGAMTPLLPAPWASPSQHLCHTVLQGPLHLSSLLVFLLYQTEFWGGRSALDTAASPRPADRLRCWEKGPPEQLSPPLRLFPLWWTFKFSGTQVSLTPAQLQGFPKNHLLPIKHTGVEGWESPSISSFLWVRNLGNKGQRGPAQLAPWVLTQNSPSWEASTSSQEQLWQQVLRLPRREDGTVLAPQRAGTEALHGKRRMILTRMWREVSKVRCPVSWGLSPSHLAPEEAVRAAVAA